MARAGPSLCAKGSSSTKIRASSLTARDVRHAIFLIAQPESVQTDAGLWRTLMGITKDDTSLEAVEQKVAQMVEIVDDYKVIIRTKIVTPS